MLRSNSMTRRGFLRHTGGITAGALAFPYLVPSSSLGNGANVAPSNRIVLGSIGVGGQGTVRNWRCRDGRTVVIN